MWVNSLKAQEALVPSARLFLRQKEERCASLSCHSQLFLHRWEQPEAHWSPSLAPRAHTQTNTCMWCIHWTLQNACSMWGNSSKWSQRTFLWICMSKCHPGVYCVPSPKLTCGHAHTHTYTDIPGQEVGRVGVHLMERLPCRALLFCGTSMCYQRDFHACGTKLKGGSIS